MLWAPRHYAAGLCVRPAAIKLHALRHASVKYVLFHRHTRETQACRQKMIANPKQYLAALNVRLAAELLHACLAGSGLYHLHKRHTPCACSLVA